MRTTPAIPGPRHGAQQEPFSQAPFEIEATITLDDRVAATLLSYRDLIAATRRRTAMVFAWFLILALFFLASHPREMARGFAGFVTQFLSDLTSLAGLPVLLFAVMLLASYLLQPARARRRVKLWFKDEKLDQPFTATYRFEPGGLVSRTEDATSAIACRRVNGIEEAPGHVVVRLKDIEDVIALPRRHLSPEQIDKLKLWAASCHVDGPGASLPSASLASASLPLSPPESGPAEEAALTARFVPMEADRTAMLAWQQGRPGMRRRQRRGFALAFLIAALIPPCAVILAWLADPERVPFQYAFPLFIEMFASTFWSWILCFWAAIGAFMLIYPWLLRRHARSLGKQLHARSRAYENEVRLSERHLDWLQDGLHNRFLWSAFDRVERGKEHLFLCLRRSEPLLIPLRALDGDKLALFQRMLNDRIGAGGAAREKAA